MVWFGLIWYGIVLFCLFCPPCCPPRATPLPPCVWIEGCPALYQGQYTKWLCWHSDTTTSEDTVAGESDEYGKNDTRVKKCCSGLCVDLLRKFEDDLKFSYDLVRAEDPKWGTFEVWTIQADKSLSSCFMFQAGKWNGLMNALVNKKTDMVLSALKVST